MFRSLSAASTLAFAIAFATWGLFGPTPEGSFANLARSLDPYRYSLAFILLLASAHLATRQAVSDERQTAESSQLICLPDTGPARADGKMARSRFREREAGGDDRKKWLRRHGSASSERGSARSTR